MYNDSFRERYGAAPIAIAKTVGFMPTKPHIHKEIELLYIAQGHSKIKISDSLYDAQPGDLFMVNPLEVHSILMEQSCSYSHQCICFDCSLVVDRELSQALLDNRQSVPHHFPKDTQINTALLPLFHQLFQSVEAGRDTLLFEASASISLIFTELICRQLLQGHLQKTTQSDFSKKVLDFLGAHYFEQITSNTIAEQLGFTQSYFCRLFKQNFGVPFSTYLNMYRILIAKENIRTTAKSIASICAQCGFNDMSYFSKCFKQSFGISPLKYRKSQYSHKN